MLRSGVDCKSTLNFVKMPEVLLKPRVLADGYRFQTAKAYRLSARQVFEFGSFKFIPSQQALFLEGRPIRLGGRAVAILEILVSVRVMSSARMR